MDWELRQGVGHLTSPPETVESDAPLSEAAQHMAQEHVGSLVVMGDGRPVGLITDRDVALAALARPQGAAQPSVGEVASTPLLTLPEHVDALEVARFLGEYCVRRVGLVDREGALVGVLAADELLIFLGSLIDQIAHGVEREFKEERSPTGPSTSRFGHE